MLATGGGVQGTGVEWITMVEEAGPAAEPLILDGPSRIDGWGQFARRSIRRGEVVLVLLGEVVTTADLTRIVAAGKYHNSIAIGEDEHLLIDVLDPPQHQAHVRHVARTGGMNHSCDANLWLHDARTIVARRDIAVGEELAIDYALFTVDPNWVIVACTCGSPLCRGRVTGDDWRRPDVQARYWEHFSPFINERIRQLTHQE